MYSEEQSKYICSPDEIITIDKKTSIIKPQIKNISKITLPAQLKVAKAYKSFLVLPFVNKKAEDFAIRLKAIVEYNYTKGDFNLPFKSPITSRIKNQLCFK